MAHNHSVDGEGYSELDSQVALQRLLEVTGSSFEERAQLRHALASRIVIEQAKGVLSERLRLSIDEAFEVLRRAARSTGVKLHLLARRVVEERTTPAEVVDAHEKLRGGSRHGR